MQILVAGPDTFFSRNLLSFIKDKLALEARWAQTREELLKKVQNEEIALLIVDEELLPAAETTFLFQMVKSCPQMQILLISTGSKRLKIDTRNIVGVLEKPFDLEIIREIVGKLKQHKHQVKPN